MADHSILEKKSTLPAVKSHVLGVESKVTPSGAVARIATANTLLTPTAEGESFIPNQEQEQEPEQVEEDGSPSLAEMARADLDATLQLLADRAQYITGASGAAIALRRAEHHDMVCRASAGSNAPELGALLSMDHGVSGECVRTRQPLRCDDAENDTRVNREVCRELGIASVVVMPIQSDGNVIGVFELFSGKPQAFAERDLSTLQRLSQMVETAVKYAAAAQEVKQILQTIPAEAPPEPTVVLPVEFPSAAPTRALSPKPDETMAMAAAAAVAAPTPERPLPAKEAQPQKALFWTAALQSSAATQPQQEAAEVPPSTGFKYLQKCKVCSFPISPGRELCVDCEEKKWRGQPTSQPAAAETIRSPQLLTRAAPADYSASVFVQDKPSSIPAITAPDATSATDVPQDSLLQVSGRTAGRTNAIAPLPKVPQPSPQAINSSASDDSAPFLSSAFPKESWFQQNKYILGTVLLAAIIAAAFWLR